jgi:HD-GYP domain-containing protein (c-di-GMP phosphodiesterase class II)/methyl-accepting chemotaxis protein
MAQTRSHRPGLLSLWHRHPLRVHIATVFTAVILAACGLIAWSNHVQGRGMVLEAAEDLIDRIDNEASNALKNLFGPVESLVTWASFAPLSAAGSLGTRLPSLPALAEILKRRTQLAAIYVGYENGDFFLVRALRDEASRKEFGAPQEAAFLVQSVERRRDAIESRFALFDAALGNISNLPRSDFRYDPRTRPWYVQAMKAHEAIVTEPYVFFTTRQVGITIARRAANGRAVVGADVSLAQISERLKQVRPTPSSQLALFYPEGNRVIAFSDPERLAAGAAGEKAILAQIGDVSPVLGAVAADAASFAETTFFASGGREWLVKASRVSPGADDLASFAIATPLDELLREANAALRRTIVLAALVILVCVPLTWWIAKRISRNLRTLADQAAAIRRFDFSEAPAPRTRISEIFDLGRAMGDMRGTIRKFLDITTALASERNYERLLQRVLKEAHDAAGGKGAVIYLLDDEGRALRPAAQAWENGLSSGTEALRDLPAEEAASPVAGAARQTAAALHVLPGKRPGGMEFLDGHFGPAPVALLTVPLLNRAGEAVGVLCVFLDGGAEKPSLERIALVEAFAGAGAAAIDNQRLLLMQKALLESLISLVASAIDSKSPYTGGHCQRVPELTKMLARAACDAKTGPFARFDIDENGWEALHIAGWLHDCGKVTTPEYVVDKATKLETIYDRIHEVRMRFEVLKRDAEIARLKAVAAGGDEPALRAALQAELRTLDEEFAFVAACNEGGEFMAPEKMARLKAIAARTWQRTLDSRLGVSRDEGKRMGRGPSAPLPATEFLLADKPEHVIERGPQDVIPEDNPWGFTMKMPANLYNRGEIYNLCIARGTLTEEERYKINDHIVQTVIMLTKLPFPKHLKSVPELAGGHHEKMDGTGYPKRLSGGDMSVQARIMAIADIFEALTASDRPYKKGKKLSEAIAIMAHMKKEKHVDPDLFDLFLESGVYRTYAERYMEPQYIDAVDVSVHVGARA